MTNDDDEITLGFEEAKERFLEQVQGCGDPHELADWMQRFGPYFKWDSDREVYVLQDPGPKALRNIFPEGHPWHIPEEDVTYCEAPMRGELHRCGRPEGHAGSHICQEENCTEEWGDILTESEWIAENR